MVTACGPKCLACWAAQRRASKQAVSSAASALSRAMPMKVGRRGSVTTGPKSRLAVSYTHLTLPTICSV
eukprot:2089932-Alexandrium_andersonii.AAC.2